MTYARSLPCFSCLMLASTAMTASLLLTIVIKHIGEDDYSLVGPIVCLIIEAVFVAAWIHIYCVLDEWVLVHYPYHRRQLPE